MRERSWRKQLQMIDEFEVDEVTEPKGGAQPPHTFSSWRPKIGKRLLERVGRPGFEPVEVLASPAATHVRYRVRSRS